MDISPIFFVLLLVVIGISVFFFTKCADLTLRKRVFASSHGLLVLVAFLFGMFIDLKFAMHGVPAAGAGTLILFVAALASIGYCIKVYTGRRVDHLLHLVTLYVAGMAFFIVMFALAVGSGNLH